MKKLEQLVSNGVDAFNEGNLQIALVLNDKAIARGHLKNANSTVKELLYSNKGFTLLALKQYEEARQQFELANTYKFTDENAWSQFLCLASQGLWDRARKLHHHRYGKTRTAPTAVTFPDLPIPLAKDPSNFRFKNLLILNEQGFGDEILFFSAIKKLAWFCNSISLQCYPEMERLFAANLPRNVTLFIEREMDLEFIQKHDVWTNTGDFFIYSQSFSPGYSEFLEVAEEVTQNLIPRVGFCWKANIASPNAKLRSVEPDDLKSFLEASEIAQSLQKNDEDDCPYWMTHFPDTITDFYDTACLMKQLDRVVTVDTSVAHLSGSLGIPTKLVISQHHDWRWKLLDERNRSLFYPTIEVVVL